MRECPAEGMERNRHPPAVGVHVMLMTSDLTPEMESGSKKRADELTGAYVPQSGVGYVAHVATVTRGCEEIRPRLMREDLRALRSSSTTIRVTSCRFRIASSLV